MLILFKSLKRLFLLPFIFYSFAIIVIIIYKMVKILITKFYYERKVKNMKFEEWDGFKCGDWQTEINVRDFIQRNYTEYNGDK